MARKIRSLVITNKDQSVLVDLRAEYILLGFETSLELGQLTVYSVRKDKKKKKYEEKKERDKRREKFARRDN